MTRGVEWGLGGGRSKREGIYLRLHACFCSSHVQLFMTLWTLAQQDISMGFSKQEYWSGLSCTPPGDLPNPGTEPVSLMSPALAGEFFTTNTTWETIRLFATPWTVAYHAPPFMGFSRQECWSGLPFPSPGDLPDPGIEPRSPTLQADALPSEPPGKPPDICIIIANSLCCTAETNKIL